MKHNHFRIRSTINNLNNDLVAAIGAIRFDPTIDIQRCANPECIPRTIREPRPSTGSHPIRRWLGSKRVRHAYLRRTGIQNQCVSIMKTSPSGTRLIRCQSGLHRSFLNGRSTAQLDKQAVRMVPQHDVTVVHDSKRTPHHFQPLGEFSVRLRGVAE